MNDIIVTGKREGVWTDFIPIKAYGVKKKHSLFAFGSIRLGPDHVYMKNREQTTYHIHPDSANYTIGGSIGGWNFDELK